ncbi:hypothetical protein AWT69_003779 [Pseudomonas putida]|nr:hypothetical protein AWT69_003779 [Pseudomonas putida]
MVPDGQRLGPSAGADSYRTRRLQAIGGMQKGFLRGGPIAGQARSHEDDGSGSA